MCNLYSMTTNQEAMRRLARTMRDSLGNQLRLPAIFPDQLAPVVRLDRDGNSGRGYCRPVRHRHHPPLSSILRASGILSGYRSEG